MSIPLMNCSCDERYKIEKGVKSRYADVEYERFHDCAYVRKRTELARKAEENIIASYGVNMPGGRFTRLFANEMERLTKEQKLI